MKKSIPIAALLVVLTSPALAVDFSAPILTPDGKPVSVCGDKTPECDRPMTLGLVASSALFGTYPDESDPRSGGTVSPEEKVKRAALAMRVHGGGTIDLPIEDIALIKRMVGKAYGPIVVYRAWTLLDPASVPKLDAP